jgi:hypothetical protein
MKFIYSPHLYLFVYSLREGLGHSRQKIEESHKEFWSNLPEMLKVPLEAESQAGYAEYIELLKLHSHETIKRERDYYFPETGKEEFAGKYLIDGFYYPVRMSDTYALLSACSVKDSVNPEPISCFSDFKKRIEAWGNLGKTWMIAGYLPSNSNDKPEAVAQEAYEALTSQKWLHFQEGKFLGGSVFEVWNLRQPGQNLEEDYSHVLLVIYPDIETMKKAADFYDDWLRLFCFRHKILWAYNNSRQGKQLLQATFSPPDKTSTEIQVFSPKIDLPESDLEKLKTALRENLPTLSQDAAGISYLEFQQNTIEVNLYNYEKRLDYINTKADKSGNTDLELFKRFSTIAVQKYQEQLKKDHAILSSHLKVREKFIDTIRGIVEIDQAERDRRLETQNTNFQNAVAVVGVGVGTASIVASAVSPFVESITQRPSKETEDKLLPVNAWLNFGIAFLISIIIGALLGWLTLWWLRSRRSIK